MFAFGFGLVSAMCLANLGTAVDTASNVYSVILFCVYYYLYQNQTNKQTNLYQGGYVFCLCPSVSKL